MANDEACAFTVSQLPPHTHKHIHLEQRRTIGKYNFSFGTDDAIGKSSFPVRVDALFTGMPATIAVSYRTVGSTAWRALPLAAFTPEVRQVEQQRQQLQSAMSRGWNTWNRAAATAHVHLPSAFGFDTTMVDTTTNSSFHGGA